MSDEKLYTEAEAVQELMKAVRAKISAFEADLQVLRKAEINKALIPPHRHVTGTSVGQGIEDVPPGKAKFGLGKEELCKTCGKSHLGKACMGKGEQSPEAKRSGPGYCPKCDSTNVDQTGSALRHTTVNGSTSYSNRPSNLSSSHCKACGHKWTTESTKKAELEDAKGKRTSSSEVSGAPVPTTKGKKVAAPGSGGQIKRGKEESLGEASKEESSSKEMSKAEVVVFRKYPDFAKTLIKLGKTWDPVQIARLKELWDAKDRAHQAAGGGPLGGVKDVGQEKMPADTLSDMPGYSIPGVPGFTAPTNAEQRRQKAAAQQQKQGPPQQGFVRKDELLAKPPATKKAEPPMAKPPSGVNMATKVPTSKPKAMGAMPKPGAMVAKDDISAGGDVSMEKGVMSDIAAKEALDRGGPVAKPAAAKPVKLPTPAEHAQRAATHQAAMQGAFQPQGPVSSGLELARPPARPGIFGRLGKLGKAAEPMDKAGAKVSVTPPTMTRPAIKPAGQKYHTVGTQGTGPSDTTIPGAGPAGTRTQVPLGGATGGTHASATPTAPLTGTATVASPNRHK